jgi:hypothetical protein
MSQESRGEVIAKKRVVYELPGMDAVTVRRDLDCDGGSGRPLLMDLYYPSAPASGARAPAILIVAGFPDAGTRAILGCSFREMGSTASWARLAAASGIAAVAYANREPLADVHAVLAYLRAHAEELGIDENMIGLWASSGHGPLALSLLMNDAAGDLKCAVLSCAYSMDLDGATAVAEASRMWKFANACQGKSIDDLRRDIPLFIARGGADAMPRLNDALDAFVAKALARNVPLTVVNHPTGPHSFDLFDDSDTTREIVKQILAFLQFHLGVKGR